MSKELLLVAEALSNERGVSKEVVIHAIEAAIESAAKKLSDKEIDVRVEICTRTGEHKTFHRFTVVEDGSVEFPGMQIALSDAQQKKPDAVIGDMLEEEVEPVEFGRIAAQTGRQVIIQKIREAERNLIVQQYEAKLNQLLTGTVKKVTREFLLLDLGGKAEAMLLRSEMMPNDLFRVNDRIRALLYDIQITSRGPQLMLSRTRNQMLTELFRIEVPEVGENVIQVRAAARDPGNRAKIAVKTNDGRIDPVGACVGMRGARVQAVTNELAGERVDIVLWDDNPAQFVINAMAPAEIQSIVVDEDAHTMDLAVHKEHLSQAIGRGGQNVRLASMLTGWTLNVMTIEEFESKSIEETDRVQKLLSTALDIDEELAHLLVQNGFTTIEEVAYVPVEELQSVDGLDDAIIEALRNRANDYLLTKALSGADDDGSDALRNMEGITPELLGQLKQKGIVTMDDLAEQSIDDLMSLPDMTEERAGALIMKAREHWFN